jgi:hypothetical protein
MGASVKSLGIDKLGVEDRLALVEEIWASIVADAESFPLTESGEAIERAASHPERRPLVFSDVRRTVLRRFPFAVCFRQREQALVILAVFHGAARLAATSLTLYVRSQTSFGDRFRRSVKAASGCSEPVTA